MNEKLVSIVIPFFNRIPWLMEAIISVKNQTYSNWELILVNDGSTDDISEICSLVEKDPKIHLIQQKNSGVAVARNTGIAVAKGYYIALLDSDDMWDPHKLEKQIFYMEENEYLVSHTCYMLFNDKGESTEVNTGTLEGDILKKLIVSCPLNTSSAVVAKSLVDLLNPPFQIGYHYGEDACFWISLAAHAKIGVIREPLTLTRKTDTRSADDFSKVRIALVNILGFVLHDPFLSKYDKEINTLSKNISNITTAIELRQEHQNHMENALKKLDTKRKSVEKEFTEKNFFPKVSIIIPVYNGTNYMRNAIESAILQTYGNIEVIVINDGSTDEGGTESIAQTYSRYIRYFSKPNGGVATALNLGIEKMEGEYFSWLSHDDMYTPEKIEEEVRALSCLKDHTTIVAEGYQVVDPSGNYLYTVNIHSLYTQDQLANSMFLLMRGGINGCALLIHKNHFDRIGLFNPQLPTTQDYDLWFRMFRGEPILFLKSSNVLSRSHEEQGSKTLVNDHIGECDRLWIGMMNSLTLNEKVEMSGSEYLFYHDLYEFLRTSSGYTGAISHARKQMLIAVMSEYEQTKKDNCLKIVAALCGVTLQFFKTNILPLCEMKRTKPQIVFQLTYRDPKGGLNRMVVENANMFSKKYDVVIYTCGQPYKNGYPSCAEVKELAINHSPGQIEEHLNVLLLLQTDIYIYSYCCCKETLPLLEQVKQLGIKTIAWSHEDYFLPYWRESLRDSIAPRKEFLPKADAVVWLNTSSQALYGMRYTNGICIPNPSRNRTSLTIPSIRGNILVAAGRFDDSRKGLGDLLQIFSYIHKRRPDAELYIVGLVDLQLPVSCMSEITCREFIAKEGLTDQYLHLIDWTEDIDRYYQLGALHIMPSLYEGFGLVVLEAAANGTPTIAYSGSGMQDIIISNQDGVVTECGDWKKMAEATLDLLDHPDKLESMQKKLPDLLERYSPHTIYEKWERLFTSLLSNDSGALETYFKSEQTELTAGMAKKTLEELDKLGIIADRQIEIREKIVIQENTNILEEPGWKECYMNVLNSKSWKLTAPLRFIMGLFKNDNTLSDRKQG